MVFQTLTNVQQKLIYAKIKQIVETLLGITLVSVPRGKPEMEQRKQGARQFIQLQMQLQ